VDDAEYGTVDPEGACLVGNKRHPDDLPWGYGYCVAVEVVVYLKAMSLDIGVADDYIHAPALLALSTGHEVIGPDTVTHAIVVSPVASYYQEAVRGFGAPRGQGSFFCWHWTR